MQPTLPKSFLYRQALAATRTSHSTATIKCTQTFSRRPSTRATTFATTFTMTPAIQSDTHISPAETAESQLSALLHGTGISPVQATGWIRITGEDRVRWLNGMVTNSIQQLQPGQGNYNFLLSVQGRIQGDAYI